MTTGWAVSLNGVLMTSCDEHDIGGCANLDVVIDMLTGPPEGLDLPGLRTEDVTYFQRDGSKHFNDWYTPRTITLQGTVGPSTDCDDCTSVREQLSELVQAWKRSCCDTEMVIFPPCAVPHVEANAYPPQDCATDETGGVECTVLGTNLAPNPSAETEEGWVSGDPDLTATWDTAVAYTGTQSRKSVKTSGTTEFVLALDQVGETTADQIAVTDTDTYTVSVWLMAPQAGYSGYVTVTWPDASTDTSTPVVLSAGVWTRVSVTAAAGGTGDAVVSAFIRDTESDPAPDGDIGYADALLVEETATLNTYYDGDTEPVFDTATESWWVFTWSGDANESTSVKTSQAATFHGDITSGPYGVIGRPRVIQYKWLNRSEQIADVVMRFDAVDQRMYILDECGTPGTEDCVSIDPGSQQFGICLTDGELCTTGPGLCTTTLLDTEDSVDPTQILVGGTEKVYPTITLFGPLVNPTIELQTTGEYVLFEGVVADLPVTINTEDGTAFDSEGTSLTHLLRGSLFLSMYPGEYSWRLLAFGTEDADPGYATLCFRNTVVSG